VDGWEWTKVAGAVGAALFVAGGGAWFAGHVVVPDYPDRRGYAVEGVQPVNLAAVQRGWPGELGRPGDRDELLGYVRTIHQAVLPAPEGAAAAAAAAPADLGTLLAAADASRGERSGAVCLTCHTFESGGPNRTGPNLHAVLGKPVAARPGFAYSPALQQQGGTWTYELLDRFLASPSKAVPGTKMAFAGLRNPRDRANLIAWLARTSPGAPPFPPPQVAAAEPAEKLAAAAEKAAN
jgi:cytochrome c